MRAGRPEVLCPAGDMERLTMDLTYGADAVYLAGGMFGMRKAAGNFTGGGLAEAVRMSHEKGVRVYVTCNTSPRSGELDMLPPFLRSLSEAGADAVIVSDMGVFAMAKKYAPDLGVHISTQTGVTNYACARELWNMGAKRVILARELTLDEVAEIRAKTPPQLEIEVFVHGSMCVSFSGRCLLSEYLTGRDANRGDCAQPCRWKYRLMEEKRPGELYEICEDGGTYIMNSRDLCMIDHIPDLMAAGADSLKIEGRMKSAYYAAVTANAYRRAADAAAAGEPLSGVWRREVEKVSHRLYSTGFFFGGGGPGECYGSSHYFSECDVAAQVESCGEDNVALLSQRNKFCEGDALELLTPEGEPVSFTAGEMFGADGERISSAPHPMMTLRMKLPEYAPRYSFLRKSR